MSAGTIPASPTARVRRLAVGMARWVRDHREGGATNRGERAELRRLDPNVVPPEAYWRLAERFELEAREDHFWLELVPMLVDHPHGDMEPGGALAASGVTGTRVERWLRFDAQRARREARRLFARCDRPFDWGHFAALLFLWNDQERRRLARGFFLAPEQRKARANDTDSAKEEGT